MTSASMGLFIDSGSTPLPDIARARWSAKTARARRGRDCRERDSSAEPQTARSAWVLLVRNQRTPPPTETSNSIGIAITVIPGDAAVHEAIELVAGNKFGIQLLIEAQLQRTGHAVITAGLGRSVASAEGRSPKIKLLRQVERPGRYLAGTGDLERPCVRQGLIAREPGIKRRERGEAPACETKSSPPGDAPRMLSP